MPRNTYIYPIPNCCVGRQVCHFPPACKNLCQKIRKKCGRTLKLRESPPPILNKFRTAPALYSQGVFG